MASDQPHGLEGPEDGQETVQDHDRTEGNGMAGTTRTLGHCTGHDTYAHDCTSCRASEISLARATGTRTADVMARQLAGAVSRVAALEEALDLAGTRLGEYRDYDGTREVEDALGRPIGER